MLDFWEYMLVSAVVGIIVGILTVLGQRVLPGNWNSVANSGTVWLIPAFFIGALGSMKARSVIASIITLFGMVLGYYGYAMVIQDVAHSIFFITVWMGAAVIGGVFITEGLNLFLHIEDYRHMLAVGGVQILVDFVLVLVLERSTKERVASLLTLLPVIVLGMIGYQILYYITT